MVQNRLERNPSKFVVSHWKGRQLKRSRMDYSKTSYQGVLRLLLAEFSEASGEDRVDPLLEVVSGRLAVPHWLHQHWGGGRGSVITLCAVIKLHCNYCSVLLLHTGWAFGFTLRYKASWNSTTMHIHVFPSLLLHIHLCNYLYTESGNSCSLIDWGNLVTLTCCKHELDLPLSRVEAVAAVESVPGLVAAVASTQALWFFLPGTSGVGWPHHLTPLLDGIRLAQHQSYDVITEK